MVIRNAKLLDMVLRRIFVTLLLAVPVLLVSKKLWREPLSPRKGSIGSTPLKLYWFVPDGLRADPTLFNIYEWAQRGELPNIKRMMETGSYGFSAPVFPSHTPVNFASLMTGSMPDVHGVADGPMRIEGYPLEMSAIGGFRSTSKLVPPLWQTLEDSGESVVLASVPGSTPPELNFGLTLKGRWGGWGFDFPSIVVQSESGESKLPWSEAQDRVFHAGPKLTVTVPLNQIRSGWPAAVADRFAGGREASFDTWGVRFHLVVREDGLVGISKSDKVLFAEIAPGEWSSWIPLTLKYQTGNPYDIHQPQRMKWENALTETDVPSRVKIRVIAGTGPNELRLRVLFDGWNKSLVEPASEFEEMQNRLGPMVDFPDNYPAQLIHSEDDRSVFFEEAEMSLDWHLRLAKDLVQQKKYSVVIHDVYTPNQLLTSRWWLGCFDPTSDRFSSCRQEERRRARDEIVRIYKGIDRILGEILDSADANTVVVLSSDHGIVALNQEVRLNNLFAKRGWLKTRTTSDGQTVVDWKRTSVVFLKMYHVYINPNGLSGSYRKARGPEYEKLRDEVIDELTKLRDKDGRSPVGRIVRREEAGSLHLPKDRVGDLILANAPGFNWIEETTHDQAVFKTPLVAGYKQAVLPDQTQSLLTPFMVVAPGVRQGYQIPLVVKQIDQYPTIMKLLGKVKPAFVQGKEVSSIFE